MSCSTKLVVRRRNSAPFEKTSVCRRGAFGSFVSELIDLGSSRFLRPRGVSRVLEVQPRSTEVGRTSDGKRIQIDGIIPTIGFGAGGSLGLSVISVAGAAVGSWVFVPVLGLALLGMFTAVVPITRAALRDYLVRGRIGMAALDVVFFCGAILVGQIMAASLAVFARTIATRLLSRIEANSQKALTGIFQSLPRQVWLVCDGAEVLVNIDQVKPGDIVVVVSGETIPVDGEIVWGMGRVDQSSLTGEFRPAELVVGNRVLAATSLLTGKIRIRADKAGSDTVAASIVEVLNNTAEFKDRVQENGQRIADRSALPTLGLGLLTWPLLGPIAAIAVVNSCWGIKMRILGPLGLVTHLAQATRRGIIIKDGRSLQLLGEVDMVVFDKTGTLTTDEPVVQAIHCCDGVEENEVIALASAVEQHQPHPLARGICARAVEQELSLPEVVEPCCELGLGVEAVLVRDFGHFRAGKVWVGSRRYMDRMGAVMRAELLDRAKEIDDAGNMVVVVGVQDEVVGIVELAAQLRAESKRVLSCLREQGLFLLLLSGDHEGPTKRLARELGFHDYRAGALPQEKAELITEFQTKGHKVCFVGDGINDVLALKEAAVSMSLAGASSIATDTASIVLASGRLTQVLEIFEQARIYRQSMNLNLLLTIIPGLLTIGGVYFLHFGIYHSVLFNNAGLAGGVVNSVVPRNGSVARRRRLRE